MMIGCCISLNAQESNKKHLDVKATWGGIKAEANISNFFISGTSVIDSKMKLGFTGGGAFLNLEFSEHFALQGELIYHYKSSDFDREDLKGSMNIGVRKFLYMLSINGN